MRTRVLLALGGLLLALTSFGCSRTPEPDGEPLPAASHSPATTPRAGVTIDARRQRLIGVRTAPVERGAVGSVVRATGIVTFPETTQIDVSAKVDGWIRDLKANYTGMRVQKGDPLFVLYSPTLLAIENEFVAALLGRALTGESTVPEVRAHTEQLIDIVRGRLLLLDVSVNEVRELERRGRALGEMTFVAPASGIVVEKEVVEGMYVMPGQRLFRLADASTVWVEVGIHERDVAAVAVGQAATLTFDAFPGESFQAKVAYLHPVVSEAARTVTVRLELANPRGRIRPGMYGAVTITGRSREAVTVPIDAIVDSGTEQLVFLAEGNGYFQPQHVRLGRRLGDRIEILEGLQAGQTVASGAAFFIDSESQMRGALLDYTASPGAVRDTASSTASTSGGRISLRLQPDPPRAGTLDIEATVTDAGRPVDGADVRIVFSMPAMPSMGMGAMRSEARLTAAGNGRYAGHGEIVHGGRWDVQVTASQGGRVIASHQASIMAR